MRIVRKPKHMCFAEACLSTEHGNDFVDLKRPLEREANFSLGVKLMSQRVGDEDWTLQAVVHRTSRAPLWRARDMGRGDPVRLTRVKRARTAAAAIDRAINNIQIVFG